MQFIERSGLNGLDIGLDNVSWIRVNSHRRGQRIASEATATPTKAAMASQVAIFESPPSSACAPRNDVVIAAAESRRPALVRKLSMATCCSERARTASS